ncbi:hypothetical protein P3L10_022566 [Capsicum annuum]
MTTSFPINASNSPYSYSKNSFLQSAIHWLSKCPEELLDEKSPAWNKGSIHYVDTSNVEVLNANVAQFEKDMEMLLNARAEEIVEGGMMVIISPQSSECLVKFFGSSLMDLVSEGKLDESLVDSFNVPTYFPSPKDMTKAVEKNNCFTIERIELTYPKSKLVEETDGKTLMINLRAVVEVLFVKDFESDIAEEAFTRTILKSDEISTWIKTNYQKACQLFVYGEIIMARCFNMSCGAMNEAALPLIRGRGFDPGYGKNSVGSAATLMGPSTRDSN